MAVLGDNSAAVAAKDEHLASEPVAAESSASGSEHRGIRLQGTRLDGIFTICSINTNVPEHQYVQSILPNDMEEAKVACKSFSCSSCLENIPYAFSQKVECHLDSSPA